LSGIQRKRTFASIKTIFSSGFPSETETLQIIIGFYQGKKIGKNNLVEKFVKTLFFA